MRRCAAALLVIVVVAIAVDGGSFPWPTVSGRVTYAGAGAVTIQTAGRRVGIVEALTLGADALGVRRIPYVWGGGHGRAGTASIGITGGPGFNGHRTGYDCSGAVAAVLAAAGLWPAGSPVPADGGVITALRRAGLILPGTGAVTLYDDPGVHIFLGIDGHFFGTADGGSEDPNGIPSWFHDRAPDTRSPRFMAWHFRAAVLARTTTYGPVVTVSTDRSVRTGAQVTLPLAGA